MIGRVLSMAGGRVTVEVTGATLSRFLTACAAQDIVLYRLKRTGWNQLRAEMRLHDFRRLPQVMGRTGCRVHVLRRHGMPFLLHKLRLRYALWAGGLLIIMLCYILTTRIWAIEVKLSPDLPRGEIMEQLGALGVHIGARRADIDVRQVRWKLMEQQPSVGFLALNIIGNRLTVQGQGLRKIPEMIDDSAVTQLIATRDGVLVELHVEEGEPQFHVGDAVRAGETLVSGLVPPRTETGAYRLAHARGEIYAQTAYTLHLARALETTEKQYTGRESVQVAVLFGNNRMNLYFGSGISGGTCDKISYTKSFALSSSVTVPVRIVVQRYRWYETRVRALPAAEVRQQMLSRALRTLADGMQGSITGYEQEWTEKDAAARLTVHADALEQIAQEALDDSTIPPPSVAQENE